MKTTLLNSIAGMIATLLLSASACSAEWVLDHYEINGESTTKEIMLTSNYTLNGPQTFNSMVKTTVTKNSWEEGQQKSAVKVNGKSQPDYGYGGNNSAQVSWGQGRGFLQGSPISTGVRPQKAKFTSTARAVFKWNRRQNWNPETDEYTPDPNDNPPEKCWFLERATISGSENTSQWDLNWIPHFAQNGYRGDEYSFTAEHPFGAQYQGTTPGNYGSSYGANFSLDGSQVTSTDEKAGDFAIGPDRKFSGEVNLHSYLLNHLDRRANGSISWGYTAEPVKFQVLSRLKGDHDPTDLVTDFSGPSYYQQYGSSTIAAGHKEDGEHQHKADLALQVLKPTGWGNWGSVGNIKVEGGLPAMIVTNKEGIEESAALLAPDQEFDGKLKEGRAALGTLLSSDKVAGVWVSPKNSVGTSTLINQTWGNVEWKMGENGDKAWEDNFFSAMEDDTLWLWTKVLFHDDEDNEKDVPLAGHSMKFVVTRLQVQETNDAGEAVERIYTTVPIDRYSVPSDASGQTTEIILVDDIDASDYIEFSPEVVEDEANGIYKTQLKVLKNPAQKLRHFVVELEDQGVFHLTQ